MCQSVPGAVEGTVGVEKVDSAEEGAVVATGASG